MINNFMIFGDSYSTHKEHIPEGYAYYYSTEGDPAAPVKKMTPEQTWWGQLIEKTDAKLILNDSWSGSTIGYTGYQGDCSTSSSFIYRYEKLFESGFFSQNKIDTVFVFGGTNDSWSNAPLGELQFSDWKREDLFSVLPAICYFMHRLKQDLPQTKIVFLANCGIKPEVIECMEKAALRIGVTCIKLNNIDKISSHPSITGMQQIAEQIAEGLTE